MRPARAALMNLDTRVRRRYAIPEFAQSGTQTSFLHPATGISYALNDTGRAILESMREEEPVELTRLVRRQRALSPRLDCLIFTGHRSQLVRISFTSLYQGARVWS